MPETPLPNLYRRLLQLIPSPCIVCGKSSRAAYSLCPDCETNLPWAGPCCIRCGEELPATTPEPRSCAGCTLHPPPFASCRAAFRYQSPIDSLLWDFKFKARFEAGNVLALLLAEKIAQHYSNTTAPDLLLPVPLHPKRLRQRGFNQALEITAVVSKKCGIPLSRIALVKMRDTTAQTKMHSANARKQNLKNVFAVADKGLLSQVKSVALIDDVVTTMATVSSVSRELRDCGIRQIEIWCLARASR